MTPASGQDWIGEENSEDWSWFARTSLGTGRGVDLSSATVKLCNWGQVINFSKYQFPQFQAHDNNFRSVERIK